MNISKKEILHLIERSLIEEEYLTPIIMFDKKWRYPAQNDDANTCKMLKLMLETEYRTGTFIFVPNIVNIANEGDRNKD